MEIEKNEMRKISVKYPTLIFLILLFFTLFIGAMLLLSYSNQVEPLRYKIFLFAGFILFLQH